MPKLSAILGNSFQGVQGVLGPQGAQNAQGTQGLQGAQGVQGLQGVQSSQGVQGGYLSGVPQSTKSTDYQLQTTDAGTHISTTGNITVPTGFLVGDLITIFNNTGLSKTISPLNANVTLRLAGTSGTGQRSIAQYGLATLLCVSATTTPTQTNTFVVAGSGIT
jgi:hypothetical protein